MTGEQKTLDLYPIDYPFETLFSRMSAAEPKLVLNPEFQRKYKWDKDGWERASKFIESCLMRIPLPSCYFAEDESGRHVVIDGVQRLTTILRFFRDEFALEGTTTFKELEGKKFSELGELKTELEGSTIRCIVLRKSNSKTIIREIFSRLNQGAVELSDQEIRHALFPGPFDDLLAELAETKEIKDFGLGPQSKKPKDGREGEEQVLRYFAFRGSLDGYDGRRLATFLDGYMEAKQQATPESIDALRQDFAASMKRCVEVFGDDVFADTSKERQRQSMVYYDLLMQSFAGLTDEIVRERKDQIKRAFLSLCASRLPENALWRPPESVVDREATADLEWSLEGCNRVMPDQAVHLANYESQIQRLKSVIATSQARVIQDPPDALLLENLNFFMKAYLVSLCTYLEAFLQDVAFEHVRGVEARLSTTRVPSNLIRWCVSGEVKRELLVFADFSLGLTRKAIADELSGNPGKTIALFRYLGIDLLASASFEELGLTRFSRQCS